MDHQCRLEKCITFITLSYYCLKQEIIDSPHVHLDFSGMNNSLAMLDRTEIEKFEPFLKEKAQKQMIQAIIHTGTFILICHSE